MVDQADGEAETVCSAVGFELIADDGQVRRWTLTLAGVPLDQRDGPPRADLLAVVLVGIAVQQQLQRDRLWAEEGQQRQRDRLGRSDDPTPGSPWCGRAVIVEGTVGISEQSAR